MEAIILIGIQASGKTTFYRERFFQTHIRLSLDMLHTRVREKILIEACLRAQQPFLIDNTNVRAADRASYIEAARRAGFQVTGYYFPTRLRDAIGRNARRSDKQSIPVKGILGTYKRLQPPVQEEGFDGLYIVSLDSENHFSVLPWQPQSAGSEGSGDDPSRQGE